MTFMVILGISLRFVPEAHADSAAAKLSNDQCPGGGNSRWYGT